MADTPSERHDRLAATFVHTALAETRSSSELMVVLESCVLAAMLGMHRLYSVRPDVAVGLVEAAIHRATDRFAAKVGKRKDC
jgi:hypothetical protein